MKKAVVHIGNVKTGTSAIQAVLRALRPQLAEAGVIVPGLKPTEPAHYAIWSEMNLPQGQAPRTARIFAETAAARDDQTVLITAETLMYVPPEWLKEQLEAAGCTSIRIILYVRPHISLLASFYLQNLKNGIIRGPVSDHLGMLRGHPVQFIQVTEACGAVFGADNVVVREFHRSVLQGGSIVGDFWDAADLPASLRQQAEKIEQINNPTPTAEVALLLRACSNWLYDSATEGERQQNEDAPDGTGYFRVATAALCRALMAHDAELPGTRFRLPVYLQHALNAQFRAERESYAATWFRQKPSPFWVDEPVEQPQPLHDLPAMAVKTSLKEAIVKLRLAEKSKAPQALITFRKKLPVVGEQPSRMIATGMLAATYNLADDVAPKDGALQRLLTPK